MPNVNSERSFQKQHILKQKNKYLETDIREKAKTDLGYKYKLELFENALKGQKGYILDLGANTCGESEYLVSKGYKMVASDVSEVGLSLSKQRTEKFGYKAPDYYSFDAHNIPFCENTFNCVIASEVLHHFEKIDMVMSEINRVLKPGGLIIALEPYAFNPYRRLSEIPHYFTGSIEKSFSQKGIKNIIVRNDLELVSLNMVVIPPSSWKMKYQSTLRNMKQKVYYSLAKLLPNIFGFLFIVIKKKGELNSSEKTDLILRCPKTKKMLERKETGYFCKAYGGYIRYPIYKGIPVLVYEDSLLISQSDYEKL